MPSADSGGIIKTIFGCCLGHRFRSASESDGAGDRARLDGSDERTPLIGGRGQLERGTASGGDGKTSPGTGQKGSSAAQGSNNDQSVLPRKRSIDVARLRAIRDQANDAFFYVDNSQLLPSSSSSQPMNVNASQMMGSASLSKREGKVHHQELVVDSDKAERLYKAAIASAVSGSSEESTGEREAAVSLVRQMQVSIREAAKVDAASENGLANSAGVQRKLSQSPQDVYGTTGQDPTTLAGTEELRQPSHPHQLHTISRLPSLHSLRTLRLTTPSFNRGATSPSMSESEKSSTLGRQFSADEEDWSRRGRTRSTRGLAWIDSGLTKDTRSSQGKARLDEVFTPPTNGATEQASETVDEVPNALRLRSKQSQTMKEVQERLMATTSIAEVWDSSQDNVER